MYVWVLGTSSFVLSACLKQDRCCCRSNRERLLAVSPIHEPSLDGRVQSRLKRSYEHTCFWLCKGMEKSLCGLGFSWPASCGVGRRVTASNPFPDDVVEYYTEYFMLLPVTPSNLCLLPSMLLSVTLRDIKNQSRPWNLAVGTGRGACNVVCWQKKQGWWERRENIKHIMCVSYHTYGTINPQGKNAPGDAGGCLSPSPWIENT